MATEEHPVWQELAELIKSCPADEQERCLSAIRHFKHDLQNRLGLISMAEGLLEKLGNENPNALVDWELLEIIKQATDDSFKLLARIDDLVALIEGADLEDSGS